MTAWARWLPSIAREGLAHLRRALRAGCRLAPYRPGRAPGLSSGRRLLGRRRARGRVALTFDDGPLRDTTGRLLDGLRAHGVQATFFVVGKMINIHTFPLIRRMRREGHALGNHGYHHDVELLRSPDAARLLAAELGLTQALVDLALLARGRRDFETLRRRLLGGDPAYELSGSLVGRWPGIARRWARILAERTPDGASPHRMIYTRPPGGSPYGGGFTARHHRIYARVLARLGLINVLWDEVTPESDTRLPGAARRDPARQTEALVTGAREGGLLLAHDRIRPEAVEAALTRLLAPPDPVRTISLDRLTWHRFGCGPRQVSVALQAVDALTPSRAPAPRRGSPPP